MSVSTLVDEIRLLSALLVSSPSIMHTRLPFLVISSVRVLAERVISAALSRYCTVDWNPTRAISPPGGGENLLKVYVKISMS